MILSFICGSDVVVPFESLIEFGKQQQAESLMQERLVRHKSWAFEQICRQYIEDSTARWGHLYTGKYWDNAVEIDVIATDEKRNVQLAGECKWQKAPVGMDVMNELSSKVRRTWPERSDAIRFVLFSMSGFTKSLTTFAQDHGVELFDGKDLA